MVAIEVGVPILLNIRNFAIRGQEPVNITPTKPLSPANKFKKPQSSLECLMFLAHLQFQGVEQTIAPLLELEEKEEVIVNDVGWRLISAMAMVDAAQYYDLTDDVRMMCRVIFKLATEALVALTGIEGILAYLNTPTSGDRGKWELATEILVYDKYKLMRNLKEDEANLLADALADSWTGHYLTLLYSRPNRQKLLTDYQLFAMDYVQIRQYISTEKMAAEHVHENLEELADKIAEELENFLDKFFAIIKPWTY